MYIDMRLEATKLSCFRAVRLNKTHQRCHCMPPDVKELSEVFLVQSPAAGGRTAADMLH